MKLMWFIFAILGAMVCLCQGQVYGYGGYRGGITGYRRGRYYRNFNMNDWGGGPIWRIYLGYGGYGRNVGYGRGGGRGNYGSNMYGQGYGRNNQYGNGRGGYGRGMGYGGYGGYGMY